MNLPIGRKAELSERMESELAAWLHGFEPAGTPIAFRLRTFADLQTEAERPRRRLSRLMPALSPVASLAAVVLGIGLIAVLALAAASMGQGVGSTVQPYSGGPVPPAEGDGATVSGALALLALIALSCLAGGAVRLQWVRAATSRMAFGKGGTAPAAPLPLWRPWRSIPRLTWFVAALGLLAMLLTIRLAVRQGAGFLSGDVFELGAFLSLCSQIVAAPLALVVSWRYPRRDRSSRLLLVYALSALTFLVYVEVTASFDVYLPLWPWTWLLYTGLGALGATCLAAGLAGRCGSVPRPPLWLAALAFGGTLFLVAYSWADRFFSVMDPGWLQWVAMVAVAWITAAAGLAVTWVGLSACRRGGSRAWWLVLAAGALQASSYSFNVLGVGAAIAAQPGGDAWSTLMNLGSVWMVLATILSTTALLTALLIGLRPVPPDEAGATD